MKLINTYEDMKRFIEGSGVVRGKKSLKIFYGETVDEFGMPIDSLKYYFFLSLMAKHLAVNATVVVADTASLMNDSTLQKQESIKQSLKRRIQLLEKIIAVYHLPITIRLMSEIFQSNEYKIIRQKVERADMKPLEPLLAKTVLANKFEEEKKKNFRYALDAIATGLLFDIKIGPPRERFYDEAGEIIVPGKLKSIYLTPTQPLGQNFAFFLTHPEIEEYGVTPYKAGSNKLQNFRIILGETPMAKAKELIETSFESVSSDTVHPAKDLHAITELARRLLQKDRVFTETAAQVREYIYKPLELEEL